MPDVPTSNRINALAVLLVPFMLLCCQNSWAVGPNSPYLLSNKFGTVVAIDPEGGSYSVEQTSVHAAGAALLGGQEQVWLGKGLISVYVGHRWFRSSNDKFFSVRSNDQAEGRLVLSGTRRGSATDSLGSYDFIELNWTVPGEGIPISTAFHLYKEKPYLVFLQRFPKGFKNYANGDWTAPSVAFPQFISLDWSAPQNLHSWTSGGMWNHRFGYGDAFSIQGTVDPLVISDPGYATLILSSFGNYLVATQQSGVSAMEKTISRGSLACGIEGLVQEIPPGLEHQHIMVVGQGIHNTFQEWGRALLNKAGKKFVSKYQDDTLKYPVYMDDAGAYYYEHDFKESGYKTYADIILAIEREAKEHDLRIGAYHVLDDPQQLTRAEGLFEPRSDLFPEGLAKFHERLGKPLELYTLWLRSNSPYRKKYAFFDVGTENPPRMGHMGMGDVFYSIEYWRFTADKLASWGAILLQIDFLSDYEGNPVMMSSVDRMDTYFKNMAKALHEKGIDIQYGMALPRNIMESTENPLMVSLQASEDHHVPMTEPHPPPDNPDNNDPFFWKHTIFTSAFYGAVSIWPSRDNIQTVADPNAFEDTLIANLLGGSIQLGHRIGECNFDLVRHTYREGDGLVLKPDRPIVPIDRCYQSGCALGYTQSDISEKSWYYVLSLPTAGYTPHFAPSDLGGQGQFAVYNWDTSTVCFRHADSTVALVPEAKHEYFIVAPLFSNGMAILGDLSKFVTMADKRIDFVREEERSLRVGVIANAKHSPIISGYSAARPSKVEGGGVQLEAVSSLDRLKAAQAGWFWDYQTKLWHVKVDFTGAADMETRVFSIY